MIKRILSLIY